MSKLSVDEMESMIKEFREYSYSERKNKCPFTTLKRYVCDYCNFLFPNNPRKRASINSQGQLCLEFRTFFNNDVLGGHHPCGEYGFEEVAKVMQELFPEEVGFEMWVNKYQKFLKSGFF